MSASSNPLVTPVELLVPAPTPKRDKFASMVARQPQIMATTNDATISISNHLTNVVATQQQQQQQQQQQPGSNRTVPVVNITPKRDKLASMASLQSPVSMKRDTLELLSSTVDSDCSRTKLQARIQQRQTVLQDLESTEGLTWKLIHLARDTAHALTDLTGTTGNSNNISALSNEYRETLSKIHQTLQPHGHLVQAYQNHQVDAGQKEEMKSTSGGLNMYAARVEMKLAQEKQRVMSEMLRLEKEEEKDTMTNGLHLSEISWASDQPYKRKRDD